MQSILRLVFRRKFKHHARCGGKPRLNHQGRHDHVRGGTSFGFDEPPNSFQGDHVKRFVPWRNCRQGIGVHFGRVCFYLPHLHLGKFEIHHTHFYIFTQWWHHDIFVHPQIFLHLSAELLLKCRLPSNCFLLAHALSNTQEITNACINITVR